MAKLYFHYSTMNAGKSTLLLQASHNYYERGMQTYLLAATFDTRAGSGRIGSRIGLSADADMFTPTEDLFVKIKQRLDTGPCSCVFLDEAQFLSAEQVWQLARAVDDLGVPVMCYGLRVDFRGKLFPGSAELLALRMDAEGRTLTDGAQVQIGGNETYTSLCRKHWREATGDVGD